MLKLKTEARKAGESRKTGVIPAVMYGPKTEAMNLAVSEIELNKAWKSAGESSIITLEGAADGQDVLIHDIARNPVTDAIIHVDFYAVDKNQKLTIDVPLEFVGVSPAVKDLGGVFMTIAHEIGIEALPKDLPHGIEVDISGLVNLEDQIKASDIKLPAGVTLNVSPDEVIALVTAAKEEVEEDTPTTIDMDSIGLSEKKGKKEEDAADGEAAAE